MDIFWGSKVAKKLDQIESSPKPQKQLLLEALGFKACSTIICVLKCSSKKYLPPFLCRTFAVSEFDPLDNQSIRRLKYQAAVKWAKQGDSEVIMDVEFKVLEARSGKEIRARLILRNESAERWVRDWMCCPFDFLLLDGKKQRSKEC